MEKDWKIIYSADEEYKASIIRQKLEDSGLHPVVMDKKDDEFRIGSVHVYVSELEFEAAKELIGGTEQE